MASSPGPLGLLLLLGLPAVGAVAGVALLRRGLRTRRRAAALAGTDPTAVGDLTPGDDYAVVEGRARPADEGTTEASILGAEALVVETEVRSPSKRMEEAGPDLTTDHRSTDAVPFVVADDTGRARVELPDAAAVRLREGTEVKVSHGALAASAPGEFDEDVPEGVREYVEAHDTAATHTRWYRQGAVRPGDRIRVAGEVTEGPARSDAPPVTITGVEDPELVVAWNEADLPRDLGGEGRLLVLLGGLFAAVGGLTLVVVATLLL